MPEPSSQQAASDNDAGQGRRGWVFRRQPTDTALSRGIFPEASDGRSLKTSATWKELEFYKTWIVERLEAGWHAVTVFEELPIKVPRSSFYRFLMRHKLNEKRKALRRVVPEIVHTPGEALLIDWGHLWTIERNGRREKLWAFVGILGYSRYMVVRLMTQCDQQHTLSCLQEMYEALGGIPRRTTWVRC